MANINVRVVGTANTSQMGGAFSKLQAQVTALNASLAQMVALQDGVDPSGYERMTKAAAQSSKTFRNAAASTGMLETQQLKVNRATDDYIQKLQKQQMSFREMRGQRAIANAALREQVSLEKQLYVAQNRSATAGGKHVVDVAYANDFNQQMATAGQRLHFFNQELKSGAHQMVNWGKNTQWAGRQMMVGFTMPMAAFGAAAGIMAYKVDKEMTRITKVYDTAAQKGIAREKELAEVRKAASNTAIQAAKDYGSAGLETLNVQAELAATGVKGAELQKVTSEVMRISRLGELEYQDAIGTTIALQGIYKMSNVELTETFNYMNSIENATSLQTKDFAKAIPIAGAAVKTFGGDIKELGILLTAMRERGIGASEGANAIKASMQRLSRPSKQIQEEFTALTGGFDIKEIVNDSDNLTEIFTKIGDVTKNLGDDERREVFAGLFGSYQVARMMAMTDGMQDLADGTGQVSKAFQIAQQDSSEWAKTADRETKELMSSISGQWDAALNEMLIQLSTMGKPFVQIATVVVKGISAIISQFNELPHAVKIVTAIALGFAAIAGPVIMLTGLIATLGGSGLKIFAGLLGGVAKLMGATKLMTVAQRAENAMADMATKSLGRQTSATDLLTMHTNALTASLAAANKQQRQLQYNQLIGTGMTPSQAATKMDKDYAANAPVIVGGVTGPAAADADKLAKSAEDTKRRWKATAGYMGMAAMAGSAMLMTSEGTVGNIAEMVFYAALLGPLLFPLGGLVAKGFKAAIKPGSVVRTTMASTTASAKTFGSNLSKAPIKSVGLGMARILTSTTFIGAAVVGIGYGLYKWHEYQKKIAEQERAQERAIVSRTNLLADSLDLQIRKQKELNTLTASNIGGYSGKTPTELAAELTSTDEGKALVTEYDEADETQQATIAAAKYTQVLEAVGGNSVKARQYVEALFVAAGDGALEAQTKAAELYNTLGAEVDTTEQKALWTNLISSNMNADNLDEAKIQGLALGKALADGMARSAQGTERLAVFKHFNESIGNSYNEVLDDMDEMSRQSLANLGVTSAEEFRKIREDFQKLQAGTMTDEAFGATWGIDSSERLDAYNTLNTMNSRYADQLANIGNTEAEIAGELARQLGIKEEITSMAQLQATYEFKLQVMTKQQSKAQWESYQATLAMADAMRKLYGDQTETTYETQLMNLNMRRVALGMKETGVLGDGFKRATVDINGNVIGMRVNIGKAAGEQSKMQYYAYKTGAYIKDSEGNMKRLGAAARSAASAFASLTSVDVAGAYKSAMSSFQQDIADREMEMFDRDMQSSLDTRQAMWDGRADALSNEMDRRGAALDAKWENKMSGAEKYWDKRVEGVENAIEAEEKADEKRQKMFEAEIARINALNDAMNTNIDFNVALSEGNFDEAAKIRNDVSAKDAQTALDRATVQGTKRSDRRVQKLEGRRDHIEKARDKAMAALEKQEAAEREHLDRISSMRQDALAADTEADMEAQNAIWENRKEMKEMEMENFTNLIALNKKHLEKLMDDAGISYEKFEKDTILPKGEKWGTYFGEQLRTRTIDEARKLANDRVWEDLGKKSIDGMLKGMGFKGMEEFKHFAETGKFGGSGGGKSGVASSNTGGTSNNSDDNMGGIIRHEGGFVGGDGKNSRKGVARTLKGTHSSEVDLRAQKGEFVVNKKDASKHSGLLTQINNGQRIDGAGHSSKPGVGGEPMGAASVAAAGISRMFSQGVGHAMQSGYDKRMAKNKKRDARRAAATTSGSWGSYALPGVKPWVLEAANWLGGKYNISTILGVGQRSNYSEHPLGRALDFMTSDERGSKLANDVVKYNGVLDAMYVIWRQKINSFDGQGWRAMEDRGSPTANHMDHVHVSFDPTGDTGDLPGFKLGGSGSAGAPAGPGGKHKASVPGKGWSNTHDYQNGLRSPLYAVDDGVIVESQALPPSAGSGQHPNAYPKGYGSYGVTSLLRTNSGDYVRYAHMWPGTNRGVGPVAGGTKIGESASTGNSSGPHTHFDVNGSYDAQGWFARNGIALKTGGFTVSDGLANLHKNEVVIDPIRTQKLFDGIDNFASGGSNQYNVVVNVADTNASADDIANRVISRLERRDARKPGSRRG